VGGGGGGGGGAKDLVGGCGCHGEKKKQGVSLPYSLYI